MTGLRGKSAHTLGPWEWSWAKDGDLADGRIFTSWKATFVGAPLCVAVSPRYQKQTQWEADARLIAAAPDLLEALRFLMQTTWKSDDKDNMEFVGRVSCYQLDKARAALAKATEVSP